MLDSGAALEGIQMSPRISRIIVVSNALAALLVAGCAAAQGPAAVGPEGGGLDRPSAPVSGRAALDLPTDRPLRAGFLVVDGVYNTELVAPFDVLQHTAFHARPHPGIEVFTVSPDGGVVTTAEGLRILPDHGFDDAPPIDILVVPSAEGSRDRDLEKGEMIEWVRRTGEGARFAMSLCWGAFVLAEAGLLDGHAVTTFPGDYERFAQAFPGLDLRVNVSFVHDGKVLTSEGGARSYGVAMYLVDLLYGEEVAKKVGSGLLLPWPPEPQSRPPFVSDPTYRLRSRPH